MSALIGLGVWTASGLAFLLVLFVSPYNEGYGVGPPTRKVWPAFAAFFTVAAILGWVTY